jgi:hypothetical protein
MSSRFGRRKRRQAREQLERLTLGMHELRRHAEFCSGLAEDAKEKYDVLREQISLWDRDVRNMISPLSSLLFETKKFRGTEDEPRQLAPTPPLTIQDLNPSFDLSQADTMVAYVERIHHLRVQLSDLDPIKFIRYLRLRIEESNHEVHYAISGSMLYDNKLTERDVMMIANDVAELLVRELNKPRKRR